MSELYVSASTLSVHILFVLHRRLQALVAESTVLLSGSQVPGASLDVLCCSVAWRHFWPLSQESILPSFSLFILKIYASILTFYLIKYITFILELTVLTLEVKSYLSLYL